MTILNSNLF